MTSSSPLYFVLECKAMTEATLSAKNQIVIPREAREALGLKPGDKILVVVRGGKVLILQKPKSYHAAIRGLGRGVYSKTYLHKERQSWE
jgi:AbrB family looped-hinge helix DNA binding protein